jgi:cholesterol transport system auxiliary component
MNDIIRILRLNVFFMLIFLLTSCSILSPVSTDNYTTYVINSTPKIIRKSNSHGILYVNMVKADPLYETNAMAYTSQAYQVDYFAKNRWAETPAKMLQPLILKTLQNTHYFHAVTSSTNSVSYNYILNIRLIELRQIFYIHSSSVIFSIHAEMINTRTGQITASRDLTTELPVRNMTPRGGVAAANQAVAMTLKKLAYFCFRAAP